MIRASHLGAGGPGESLWVDAGGSTPTPSIMLRVDRVGELAQIGVESTQETHGGVPADASLTTLNPTHKRRMCIEAFGKLLLREPGLVSQLAQGQAEDELIAFGGGSVGGLVHGGNARVAVPHIPEPFWSDYARLRSTIKVPGRRSHGPRRGSALSMISSSGVRVPCGG